MTAEKYYEILKQCGGTFQNLTNKDRWKLLQAWREIFAVQLHERTGKWKFQGFEWHIFSFGHARALNGPKAILAYEQEGGENLIVCPEFSKLSAVRLEKGALPNFRDDYEDVYIWPADLVWTMAFTHEESIGCGPYFCRREWLTE